MGVSGWGKTRSQKLGPKSGLERGDIIMTNGRINKRSALLAILCVLVMVFAVPVASAASVWESVIMVRSCLISMVATSFSGRWCTIR